MKKVFIAGHNGMVGSSLHRMLSQIPDVEIITQKRSELDLTDQNKVREFFDKNRPNEVYVAAARVGGILANSSYPADFIYDNLLIQSNLIHQAHQFDVQKLLFLGSSCIYPKFAQQPIEEQSLLKGELEKTNEPYAIAKIAGIKLCESYNRQHNRDYRSVMPTNLYGPGDNFHPENSHVIPGLIHRFHLAGVNKDPEVVVWGSGKPRREFLHVDDLANAALHIMAIEPEVYHGQSDPMNSHVNIGYGSDISIFELAALIAQVTKYQGKIVFDASKPDGTPRKLLDTSKAEAFGWKAKIPLLDGLEKTYKWYIENIGSIRKSGI